MVGIPLREARLAFRVSHLEFRVWHFLHYGVKGHMAAGRTALAPSVLTASRLGSPGRAVLHASPLPAVLRTG